MKKIKLLMLFIVLTLSIISAVQAKNFYYFNNSNGWINNPNKNYPFCKWGECDYENENSINIEFADASGIYNIDEKDVKASFTLDEGGSAATLKVATSGDDIFDGKLEVSKVDGTVTIPGFKGTGTAKIILKAKENRKVVDRTKLEITVTEDPSYGDAFVTTWEVNAGDTVEMPTHYNYTYNGTINWGDGTGELTFDRSNHVNFKHTYAEAGTYTVMINGSFGFIGDLHRCVGGLKMKSVEQLGKVNWQNLYAAFSRSAITSFKPGNNDISNVSILGSMFYHADYLTTIDLTELDVSNVTNIAGMFSSTNLSSVNISNWDTSNVIYMNHLFSGTGKLKTVDIKNWDTSKVQSMSSMFSYTALSDVDTTLWDTSSVTDMSYMFHRAGFVNLDLSNFNTANVENMAGIFKETGSIQSLNLTGWDTSKVKNMAGIFWGLSQVKELDVANWNTSNVTNMNEMFGYCVSLPSLDISRWDTSKVQSMKHMFIALNATNLNISNLNISSLTDGSNMFGGSFLDVIEYSNLVSENEYNDILVLLASPNNTVINNITFVNGNNSCGAMQSCLDAKAVLQGRSWDFLSTETPEEGEAYADAFITTWAVNAGDAITIPTDTNFNYNGNINWGDGTGDFAFSNANMSNLTHTYANTGAYNVSINGTFESLGNSNKSALKMTKVKQLGKVGWKSLERAFSYSTMTSFNSGSTDVSQVTNMAGTFLYARGLNSLDLSSWNTSNVTNMESMFSECANLTTLNITGFDTSQVTNISYMFYNVREPSLDISNWDTSNIIYMLGVFRNSFATELDLSGWDTSNVINMHRMFLNAAKLENLNISTWDLSKVTNSGDMLLYTNALNKITYDSATTDALLYDEVITLLGDTSSKTPDNITFIHGTNNCGEIQTCIDAKNILKGRGWDFQE